MSTISAVFLKGKKRKLQLMLLAIGPGTKALVKGKCGSINTASSLIITYVDCSCTSLPPMS